MDPNFSLISKKGNQISFKSNSFLNTFDIEPTRGTLKAFDYHTAFGINFPGHF